jgi:NAD(P)H-hydrate epimerase
VVDADGLVALGDTRAAAAIIGARDSATVLTPHDGEFARLAGERPSADRIGAVRELAQATGATVLLKGPTTVVGAPDGRVLLESEGDSRLATAGTGDVLAGVVAAFLALGLEAPEAAAGAAFVHAAAGHLGWRRGLVAGDLLGLLPAVLDRLD